MKVRKSYVLFINDVTNTAFYGGHKFDYRLHHEHDLSMFGRVFDCTVTQLKNSIKMLLKNNVTVLKMKW